jgi:hypothetical protein
MAGDVTAKTYDNPTVIFSKATNATAGACLLSTKHQDCPVSLWSLTVQEMQLPIESDSSAATEQSATALLRQIEPLLTYMIRCAYTEQVPFVSEDAIHLRQKIRGLINVPPRRS